MYPSDEMEEQTALFKHYKELADRVKGELCQLVVGESGEQEQFRAVVKTSTPTVGGGVYVTLVIQ